MHRSVSVVVNTLNRADSLELLLDALRGLDYPDFEVVVVAGPCTDRTGNVLDSIAGQVEVVGVATQNLSASRNAGIRASSGDIVAFIDDDAYPHPQWLRDLVAAFDDDDVAATGGPVFDHTGHDLQARFNLADRWGHAWPEQGQRRLDAYLSPDSWLFPYTIGTNSLFRREMLVAIGGFDERFRFYLDETDVCLRLVDRGWRVLPQDVGFVYHKFLPSGIRNRERVTVDLHNVIYSRAYFSIRHGLPLSNRGELAVTYGGFIASQRQALAGHLHAGRITPEVLTKFEGDVAEATDAGFDAAESPPATRPTEWFANERAIRRYPTRRGADALTVCLVSRDYPPGATPGIGRATHTLATGLAADGHTVHVVTETRAGHTTVDYEEGVWVHRVAASDAGEPGISDLPQPAWDRCVAALNEVEEINRLHPIDLVQVPNWDSEGLLILQSHRWPTVLYAYTPLLALLETDPRFAREDPALSALVEAERRCFSEASLVTVSFPSTIDWLEDHYRLTISERRRAYIPLAIPDLPPPTPVPTSNVLILFVGRLEPRKGIDTLLEAIPLVCERYRQAQFLLIGADDDGFGPRFLDSQGAALKDRVHFVGTATDSEVLDAYAACDIFVAPSRFESFGLINLEAMRFAKPVVSTRSNGTASVVRDGLDGLLVEPGDSAALASAVSELVSNPRKRTEMGANGRRSFEERFELSAMIGRTTASYRALLAGTWQPSNAGASPTPGASISPVGGSESSALVRRQQRLLGALRCPHCRSRLGLRRESSTADGGVKSGDLWCPSCAEMVGRIHGFQVDFLDLQSCSMIGAPLVSAPVLGERRVGPTNAPPGQPGWRVGHDSMSCSEPGRCFRFTAACTDIRARILRHPGGGDLRITVDGADVTTIGTRVEEGSVSELVEIAENLPFGEHRVEMTMLNATLPAEVHLQELILLGPLSDGGLFNAPAPFARGNQYSPQIERFLSKARPDDLVLECGGGDRRLTVANQINMEYLPFEGPDLRADIHKLPFAEHTFDYVLSQAVFEHVAQPFAAAEELVRVCKPGGLILTEVAFMQPLHAVPYHYFNMTTWGVEELFARWCDPVESDWFGELSFTINWLLDASNAFSRFTPEQTEHARRFLSDLDQVVDHEALKPVASGVYTVVRKR